VNKFLMPLAAGLRLGVALEKIAYRRGWLKARRLSRPVVSVGNLTAGGTGKTPLTAFIADRLRMRGLRPAILTRGYGRRSRGIIALEPASERSPDPREVGDEPALLARKLPGIPIVVCADRYRAGCLAEEMFGVDLHLLDDGFQHFRLARDVDIVVLDTTQEPTGLGSKMGGWRREFYSALERAHVVVLTRTELGDPRPIESRVARVNPQAKIFRATTRLGALAELTGNRLLAADTLQGKPVLAFCGIGNPQAFWADLRRWGFSLLGEVAFRDHHLYTPRALNRLISRARASGAEALVTTEKDGVNFPQGWKPPLPVFACLTETEIFQSEAFEESLVAHLGATTVRV